jgi:nitric oxide dioxygenase
MITESVYELRKSFQRVEAQGHVATLEFYRRLFEMAPGLRPMFKNDIEAQSKKLLDMLRALLGLLDRPEDLRRTLEELGARHVGYGVSPEHYAPVGAALLDMLAFVLGKDFTPALRAAWTELFLAITETMLAGAAKLEKKGAVRR